MKNYEKYAEEIRKYKGSDFCKDFIEPYILKSINTKCTNISCVRCTTYRMLWLLEEYKEPETDWSKVVVDTPILVRDIPHGEWEKRHFAKYEDGEVWSWGGGCTSWTTSGGMTPWRYAKLAESEED